MGQPDLSKVERLIVEHTNEFRRAQKLENVTTNARLEKAAGYLAAFMAKTDKYSHTADGRQPSERAAEYGYEYCLVSENISFQFNTAGFEAAELAEEFVEGWIDSPPHRRNMVDPDVTDIGVAVAQSDQTGKYYAVQMFGRPKSKQIEFSIANQTGSDVTYELDGREFTLPPRFTRTHQQCRPPELQFAEGDGRSAEDDQTRKATIRPRNRDRLVIQRGDDGTPVVRRESSRQ